MDVWDDSMQEYDLDRQAEEVGARVVSATPCPLCDQPLGVDDHADRTHEQCEASLYSPDEIAQLHEDNQYPEEGGESG